VTVEDGDTGEQSVIQSKALINAGGPWVQNVIEDCDIKFSNDGVRLVRGSHIVVPKVYDHDRCYIFQNPDGRIFFSIPYEQDFTLIGTTDADHTSSVEKVEISQEEIEYLCKSAREYFKKQITPDDVAWTYSGVRPLYDDGASAAQEATRDYVLKVHDDAGKTPVLNIFGGKITTYRKLAESALEKMAPYFPDMKAPWTDKGHLPGGDFAVDAVEETTDQLMRDYDYLTRPWAARLIRMYGTKAWDVLGACKTRDDLGEDFGATLTEAEILYMVNEEWATSAEDVLWRRSKRGLHMTEAQRARVEERFSVLRHNQR